MTFEEWAPDLGYDSDSRSAEKTWTIIHEQTRALKHLLGAEDFKQLMELTEESKEEVGA